MVFESIYFPKKKGINISCELSHKKMIYMVFPIVWKIELTCTHTKCPSGQVVSAADFGLWDPRFESPFKAEFYSWLYSASLQSFSLSDFNHVDVT